jgi:hypothetical protein
MGSSGAHSSLDSDSQIKDKSVCPLSGVEERICSFILFRSNRMVSGTVLAPSLTTGKLMMAAGRIKAHAWMHEDKPHPSLVLTAGSQDEILFLSYGASKPAVQPEPEEEIPMETGALKRQQTRAGGSSGPSILLGAAAIKAWRQRRFLWFGV